MAGSVGLGCLRHRLPGRTRMGWMESLARHRRGSAAKGCGLDGVGVVGEGGRRLLGGMDWMESVP